MESGRDEVDIMHACHLAGTYRRTEGSRPGVWTRPRRPPATRARGGTFERAVRKAKDAWKLKRRRLRPRIPASGEYLVVRRATQGGWECFCAVLARSHVHVVRFATDQRWETTQRLLVDHGADSRWTRWN